MPRRRQTCRECACCFRQTSGGFYCLWRQAQLLPDAEAMRERHAQCISNPNTGYTAKQPSLNRARLLCVCAEWVVAESRRSRMTSDNLPMTDALLLQELAERLTLGLGTRETDRVLQMAARRREQFAREGRGR